MSALKRVLLSGLLMVTVLSDTVMKRGISFTDPSLIINFGGAGSHVNWCFNWDSSATNLPPDLEYVPMLWSANPNHTSKWAKEGIRLAKAKYLLAFNEPNNPDQANINPVDAARLYNEWISIFNINGKLSCQLGAPAISNFHDGIAWLKQFMTECSAASIGCVIDFFPFHWYGHAWDTAGFYAYVEQVRDTVSGQPLWLTEFNVWGTEDEQIAFLRQVLPWLDQQDYIHRYCWFGAFPGYLVRADGFLSPTGIIYTFD